ncbi:hypothetical protein DP939_38115 [Spongiactinospora rosea]|uniref:Uncharacterized protein n=1 Tax=Spongiactinospora rosea TaxID=2248750 RepID=A0A366LNC4_9ACTN|nr:hypothetical protein [Spongiactinospora rosea]RBQ15003.1 hypothetical protein DP939_38115 [Spongiactinospora rosea]
MLFVPIRGLRPVLPEFWWWVAAAYALWEPVGEMLWPPRWVWCAGSREFHPVGPVREAVAEVAERIGDEVWAAGPFLLIVIAVFVRRHQGVRVPLWIAVLGFGLILLPDVLLAVEELLDPPPSPPPGCLPEPRPLWIRVPSIALSWVLSPLTPALLAGMAGAGVRPDRGALWRLGAATVVVLLLAQAARVVPAWLAGPPVADDGTPRYAVLANGWPETLDLSTGRTVHDGPLLPGRGRAPLQAVAATGRPGEYVASVEVRSGRDDWSPRGVISRLHRLTVDAGGRGKLGEALTGRLKGAIDRIVVSPEGRVGYARSTEDRDRQQRSYAGVLGPHREWPAKSYRLYWRDAHTLALPDELGVTSFVPGSPTGPYFWWEAAIDVRLPPSDPRSLKGRVLAPQEAGAHTLPLPLPGGRTLRVRGGGYQDPSQVLLYEGARKVATVLTLPCGDVISMAADPTGRNVLVGKDNGNGRGAGERPCGGTNFEVLRLGLTPGYPHRTVWRGASSVHDLTW